MSRKDDIAAAELAAVVGGHLNSVDGKMISRSSTDAGAQVNPSQFLGSTAPKRETTNNTNIVPKEAMVEPPKSRPAGSEVVGVEQVNVGSLMIPTDGADQKMREAIRAHSQAPARPSPPPTPMPSAPIVGKATPAQNKNVISTQPIIDLLEEINEKLDILMKRAKIQPRYKKGKKK